MKKKTREQKVALLVEWDIDSVINHDNDHSFLYSIITGDGWVPYNQLTDKQIDDEYETRTADYPGELE